MTYQDLMLVADRVQIASDVVSERYARERVIALLAIALRTVLRELERDGVVSRLARVAALAALERV